MWLGVAACVSLTIVLAMWAVNVDLLIGKASPLALATRHHPLGPDSVTSLICRSHVPIPTA